MWLEEDIKKIGKIESVSEQYLSILSNYDWSNCSHNADLGETKNIPLLFKQGSFYDLKTKNLLPREIEIFKETIPFLEYINSLYLNCKFIKGDIYFCASEVIQPPHIDPRIFHRFSHRVHWPIITNKDCFLEINNKCHHLETNTLYEFNNMLIHRSINKGKEYRIHLVVDIMDNYYYEQLIDINLFLKSNNSGKDLSSYINELLKSDVALSRK